MNSTNTTKRLFNRTLNHERIEIINYYTSEIYNVFFRKNDRSTTPQGKVRLFYPCIENIKIGTIFSFPDKGNYLVVSQDSDENNVYYTSLAIRCDEIFKVKHNNTLVSVPFVLSSEVYDISENSTISIIDGSIIAYTGLIDATKDITGTYNVFGGTYQVKNSFIRSGLIYYYLKRTAKETNTLTYTGATELDISAGAYQLTYEAKTNGKLKQQFYSLPDWLRPDLLTNNRQELTFTNGSRISCQTAGNKDLCRGDTINGVLHMSEYALWKNQDGQLQSLMQASTESAQIIIESTTKGFNKFTELYMQSINNENDFKPFFFNFINGRALFENQYKQSVKPIMDELEDLLSKFSDSIYTNTMNVLPIATGQYIESSIPADATGYVLNLDNGDFKYASCNMDYNSIKLLLDNLKQMLNDIACIPSVLGSSTNVANISEVAMKILFAMAEVNANECKKWLNTGFKQRFKTFQKILNMQGISVGCDVDVVYNVAMPVAGSEMIANLKALQEMGAVSVDTIMEKVDLVSDPEVEKVRLQNEKSVVNPSDAVGIE